MHGNFEEWDDEMIVSACIRWRVIIQARLQTSIA